MIQLTWKEVMYLHVTDLTIIRLKVMRSSFCRFCTVASLFVVQKTFKYEKIPVYPEACVFLFTLNFLPCVKLFLW